ncbi:MAG: cell division protein FtsL [Albidovulum sp.]|nr:cell division protein FtsL [Albidovulum sp.]
MRALAFALFGTVVFGLAVWTYIENYKTRSVFDKIEALENRISDKRDELSQLRAEWTSLNRPDRLFDLTKQFMDELRLTDLVAERFGEVGDLPQLNQPNLNQLLAEKSHSGGNKR